MDQARDSRMRSTRRRDCEPPLPEPLAYFLTWPTYGTWLPGDEGAGGSSTATVGNFPIPLANASAGPPDGRCLPSRPGPVPARRIARLAIIAGCGGGLSTPSIAARTMCTSSWRATANPRRSGSSSKPGAPAGSRRCSRNVSVHSPHMIPRLRRFARNGGLSVEWPIRYVNDEEGLEAVIHYVREAQDHADQPQPDEREREPVVMLSIVQGRPSATLT